MHSFYARLGLAALALAVTGCQPMPKTLSVAEQTAQATGFADPFVFHADGEATDIAAEGAATLSMLSATRLAISHDSAIQQALARARIAQAESHQQRLWPNPILELSVRFPQGGGSGIIDAGISAEILSLISRPGLISAADSRFRASHSEALATVLDVITAVQTQYIAAAALDARIGVAETRRSILRQLVNVSQSRVQAGEGSRLDTLTVQAEQANLETELIELRGEQRRARLALARMIGNPSGAADWTLDAWQAPKSPELSVESWLSLALQHRQEIVAQVWELEALGEEVKLTRLSPLDGGEVGVAAERDGDWSVGPAVAVPLPVFDFGQARRSAVEARRIEARHKLTGLRRQIVQEVRQAIEQLSSAHSALQSVEKTLLPLQQQRREQVENAYRLGASDFTAVQLAEQDLQASISKRIELQEKLSVALVQLERAVGGSRVGATAAATAPSTRPSN